MCCVWTGFTFGFCEDSLERSLGQFVVNEGSRGVIMRAAVGDPLESLSLEVDEEVVEGLELPSRMVLYAVAADHFVIAASPVRELEEAALMKMRISVSSQSGKVVFKVPAKVYNFYGLDENNYAVMVSERIPPTVLVTL
jgi:hypothetical protein